MQRGGENWGRGGPLIGASRFSPQACEEHGVESGLLVSRPSSATYQLERWAGCGTSRASVSPSVQGKAVR